MPSHFMIAELTRSAMAQHQGIDNTPDAESHHRLEKLIAHLLDPVRDLWGAPLVVNSGYRSQRLNRLVGGAPHSQHLRGEAADLTAGSAEANRALFQRIVRSDLPFDQLIDEQHYTWLHLSHSDHNRHQTLHLP